MTAPTYLPPVDKLLTYGDCRNFRNWPKYVKELGLEAEHIPELIRMATDPELNWADSDSLDVWAPIHAWRSLGQLKAEAAIDPLLSIADELEDSDWFNEDIPEVFAMIGPAAIPSAKTFLADPSHTLYARVAVAECCVKIGQAHLDARADCVAAIQQQLDQFAKNSPDFNGFLVADLLDLEAVEAAPSMERAFAARRVDLSFVGDWLDAQIALGLKTRAQVYRLRHTVDAEQLGSKAAKPAPQPQGFGAAPTRSKKGKKK
ncbi:MAG: DUF1186 domain-containing protein [Leptolyngbyaceae cyanobacterium RU_5_1]|nr:DUF1186 domain-containing protein [Leptolyngbyaceae cyanobacterium RU_5_1]